MPAPSASALAGAPHFARLRALSLQMGVEAVACERRLDANYTGRSHWYHLKTTLHCYSGRLPASYSMHKTDADGFSELWPTTFLRRKIANTDVANEALLELILAQEAARQDMTVDYAAGNLFANPAPATDWLKQCINKTVADYFKKLSIDYNIEWSLQGWANINRFGDYHNLHNHPHSYLSGTYYIAVPDPAGNVPEQISGSRSDLNPGAISFYDPRPQANMTAIRGDGQIDPEIRIQPEPGLMLLWPSFMHHLVHPNLSEELRVSVSYNVLLNNVHQYLPDN